MNSYKDIENIEDIRVLVDRFYGKIQCDPMLKDIFNTVIQDRWPEHLEKMYRFWQTVLLQEQTYFGNPFLPHANLPVQAEHFQRWLQLFSETVEEHYSGPNADRVKWQGSRMAQMFHSKIQHSRNNSFTPLL